MEVVSDLDPEIAFAFKFAKNVTPEQLERLRRKKWVGDKDALPQARTSRRARRRPRARSTASPTWSRFSLQQAAARHHAGQERRRRSPLRREARAPGAAPREGPGTLQPTTRRSSTSTTAPTPSSSSIRPTPATTPTAASAPVTRTGTRSASPRCCARSGGSSSAPTVCAATRSCSRASTSAAGGTPRASAPRRAQGLRTGHHPGRHQLRPRQGAPLPGRGRRRPSGARPPARSGSPTGWSRCCPPTRPTSSPSPAALRCSSPRSPAEVEVINDADPEIAEAYRAHQAADPRAARAAAANEAGPATRRPSSGSSTRARRDDVEQAAPLPVPDPLLLREAARQELQPLAAQGVEARTVDRIEAFAPAPARTSASTAATTSKVVQQVRRPGHGLLPRPALRRLQRGRRRGRLRRGALLRACSSRSRASSC